MGVRFVALVAGMAAAVGPLAAASGPQRPASLEEFAPLSTPKGITLQSLGKFAGYGMDQESAALSGRGQMAYADVRGMTLYTYAKDPTGASVCTGDCAAEWVPALAWPNAQPVGQWTIITRADGSRQWALRGKPLYTYVKDVDPGSVGGNSPKRFGRGPQIGERGARLAKIADDIPLPDDWNVAMHYPAPAEGIPADFAVRDVQDAGGLALLNDRNWTLYAFTGEAGQEGAVCPAPCPWQPVAAPQLAAGKGDFVPVERTDGVRQWTYKGLGLYTYAGDLAAGDANGRGVHPNWNVAFVARNFMPEGVTFQESHRIGRVLATAEGKTLYRRDSYIFQSGSGHGQRRGVLIRAAVGRDLGTDPRCVKDCEKWRPFLAPDDAVAQGDWSVYTRPDGRKQWAYIGYALWTYDGDKKPGDIMAEDDWHNFISLTERTDRVVDIGTQYNAVAALYWAAMPP